MSNVMFHSYEVSHRFYYYQKSDDTQPCGSILYNTQIDQWYMMDYINYINYVKIQKINTFNEEKLFQESLLWEYPFPIEIVYKIQKILDKNDYKFDIFDDIFVNNGFIDLDKLA